MKELIVTADDFGLSRSISEGIAKAVKEGIVTSVNFLPTGPSFEETLYLIKDLKLEEIGAHLALTETAPFTYPGQVPTLVTKNGRFHKNYSSFFAHFFLGRISRQDIYVELKSQLDRLKRIGLPITNITSHEHIHMMPAITGIFVDLAREYDIPFVRYPHGDKLVRPFRLNKFLRLGILLLFERGLGRAIKMGGRQATDHFLGFLDSGNLDEAVLLGLFEKLEDGTTELVSHPGFLSPELLDKCVFQLKCEGELSALTSRHARKFLEDNGIKLTTYGKVLSGRAR